MNQPSTVLALEDGTVLKGDALGSSTDAVFEIVFNTSLSGYKFVILILNKNPASYLVDRKTPIIILKGNIPI